MKKIYKNYTKICVYYITLLHGLFNIRFIYIYTQSGTVRNKIFVKVRTVVHRKDRSRVKEHCPTTRGDMMEFAFPVYDE